MQAICQEDVDYWNKKEPIFIIWHSSTQILDVWETQCHVRIRKGDDANNKKFRSAERL